MSRSIWEEVSNAQIGSMLVAYDANGALVSGYVVAIDGQRCCITLRSGDGQARAVLFAASSPVIAAPEEEITQVIPVEKLAVLAKALDEEEP